MDPAAVATPDARLPDETLVRRVAAGETPLFELLMRRNNPRVYRTIRAILRDEDEVEDAMQETYVSAFRNLGTFEYGARFSTWLVRIAMNEALGRLRRRRRLVPLDAATAEDPPMPPPPAPTPEDEGARHELVRLLEREIDALPDLYRTVVVLRDVDGMSTAEAAEALGAEEDAVKTRLHRGRAMLRERLADHAVEGLAAAFPFHAPRCDRVVAGVMARIVGQRAC